ncbi:hypothetical protein FRB94_013684 [Tulasnella sp. JGI-2019a]|nr:hypothetical protein FRB94_013684 [Tulasnella sp. JGI-2019a]
MNRLSENRSRKAPIQYGKRASTTAARRASFKPLQSKQDEDEDDLAELPAPTASSGRISGGHIGRDSLKAARGSGTPSPRRNVKPSGSVVEVVIVSSPAKRLLNRDKEQPSTPRSSNSLSKKRKTAFEHVMDTGDDSAGVESDDPLTITPSKRSRMDHVGTNSPVKRTDVPKHLSPRSPAMASTSAKRDTLRFASAVDVVPKTATLAKKKQLTSQSEQPLSPSKGKGCKIADHATPTSPKSPKTQVETRPSSTPKKPVPSALVVHSLLENPSQDNVTGSSSPSRQAPVTRSGGHKAISPPPSRAHALPALSLVPTGLLEGQNTPSPMSVSSEDVIMLSPKKPRAGLAKRMLARTRSGAELEVPPSRARDSAPSTRPPSPNGLSSPTSSGTPHVSPSRTASAPRITTSNLLSRPSLADTSQSQTQTPRDERDITPPPSRPAARTYGKSRSFLVDLTSTSILEPGGGDSQDSTTRESYNDLRTRWGVDMSEEAGEGSGLAPSDLRTKTELRNRGETRKFLDELGYLFEGLDLSMTLPVRRLSAIDVVSKMTDPDFVRKARITDILSRAWDVLRDAGAGSGDPILDMTLAAFTAFVAQDARAISDLSAKPDFDSALDAMMKRDRDLEPFQFLDEDHSVGDAKRVGIGKAEKKLLRTLHDLLLRSSLGQAGLRHITGGTLASFIMKSLPSKRLNLDHLHSALLSLQAELAVTQSRAEAYTKGLSAVQPSRDQDAPNLHLIENYLKVTEICMYGHLEDKSKEALEEHKADLAERLAVLGVFCEVIMVEKDSTLSETAAGCFSSALRILITLCEAETWCSAIMRSPWSLPWILRTITNPLPAVTVSPSVPQASNPPSSDDVMELDDPLSIGKVVPGEETNLDCMCYALALLTNILQHDSSCAERVGKTVMSNSCRRDQACLRKCKCPAKECVLQSLVSLYEQQAKCSDEMLHAAEAHFLQGHLAVMLGLLVVDEGNQHRLFAALPGTSPRARISDLTDTIRDFVHVFDDAANKMEQLLMQRADSGDGLDLDEMQIEEDEMPSEETGRANVSIGSRQGIQRDHETVDAVIQQLERLIESLS